MNSEILNTGGDILDVGQIILQNANKYLGYKEIPPNKGFYDKNFEQELREVGWQTGWSWCDLFTKLIWLKSYENPEIKDYLKTLFTPLCTKTWNNFINQKQFKIITFEESFVNKPIPGSLVFWHTKGIHGHTGIVEQFTTLNLFETIEGNSGDMVKRNTRHLQNFKGFAILGFAEPLEPKKFITIYPEK